MPSIALKDESQKLTGFLLVSGDEALAPAAERACSFMVAPIPFVSPAKNVLVGRKQEFAVSIAEHEGGLLLVGECAPGELFEAYLPAEGLGAWTFTTGDVTVKGMCELAKRR
jgi:hypothetical protein